MNSKVCSALPKCGAPSAKSRQKSKCYSNAILPTLGGKVYSHRKGYSLSCNSWQVHKNPASQLVKSTTTLRCAHLYGVQVFTARIQLIVIIATGQTGPWLSQLYWQSQNSNSIQSQQMRRAVPPSRVSIKIQLACYQVETYNNVYIS